MTTKGLRQSILLMALALSTVALVTPPATGATNSAKENMKQMGREAKTKAKKAGRAVADKTCRWVNGKLQCAAKKAKHKVQNATEKAMDRAKAPPKSPAVE